MEQLTLNLDVRPSYNYDVIRTKTLATKGYALKKIYILERHINSEVYEMVFQSELEVYKYLARIPNENKTNPSSSY